MPQWKDFKEWNWHLLSISHVYYFIWFLQWPYSIGSVAAAAAKSLQSCPTLCDPIDGSPPGSPIPGILQARTLDWSGLSLPSPSIGSIKCILWTEKGFSSGASGKGPASQCRRVKRHGFDPWVGKIAWKRAWQSTPVYLPGESHRREEPSRLWSIVSERAGHDWSNLAHTHASMNWETEPREET